MFYLYLGEMVWPWPQDLIKETDIYKHMKEHGNFTDAFLDEYVGLTSHPWSKRSNKVAFYGNISPVRQIIFDLSNLYPEYIDAHFVTAEVYQYPDINNLLPWNPMSDELRPDKSGNIIINNKYNNKVSKRGNYTGYVYNVVQNRLKEGVSDYWLNYKYVIVLVGLNGRATADRLGYLLAHSGAVVFLQAPFEFLYTFSKRLIPWVHYIPVNYMLTDVVDKVKWLRKNDHLARQIVQNARNFGKSYLRIEDHYCYMAQALNELGKLAQGSDVIKPFSNEMIDLSG